MALLDSLKASLLNELVKSVFKSLLSSAAVPAIESQAKAAFTPNEKLHKDLCKKAGITDPEKIGALYEKGRAAGAAYGKYFAAIAQEAVGDEE